MSFNQKAIIFCFICIIALPALGIWHYKKTHPTKIAPLPNRPEVSLTIIPGWNLRDIADNWVKLGLIKTPEDLFGYTGTPAVDYRTHGEAEPVKRIVTSTEFDVLFASKPTTVSYEGYLLPETYRVYSDAKPDEVLKKIFSVFRDRVLPEWTEELKRQDKTFFELLTMASILQDEARTPEDKKMVADILWRRLKRGMALQVDSRDRKSVV